MACTATHYNTELRYQGIPGICVCIFGSTNKIKLGVVRSARQEGWGFIRRVDVLCSWAPEKKILELDVRLIDNLLERTTEEKIRRGRTHARMGGEGRDRQGHQLGMAKAEVAILATERMNNN